MTAQQRKSPEPETQGVDPDSLGHGPQNTDGLPNVHQAIAHAMSLVRAVGKWGQNTEQRYSFRSIDDFMTALNPAMAKAGVHIVPKVLQRIVDDTHTTRGGSIMRWVDVEMRFRIYGPDGSSVDVITWGEARDSADKATNKAMTGAFKYAIMQAFMVPTQDLADGDQFSPEAEPAQQARAAGRADRRAAERAQAERQQAPPRVASPEEIMGVLQSATTKGDMSRRLAALPGGLVVETMPEKFAYNTAALREIDVVDAEGTVTTAWEAIAMFGAALPDEVDDTAVQPQPRERRTERRAERRGPQDPPDDEDARWLTPVEDEEDPS